MKAYLMQFWKIMLGGFILGILLTILLDIPWRFTLSLIIFVFLLNAIIEQAKSFGNVGNTVKKIFCFAIGVVVFVGLRSVAGYLLDMPAERSHQDLVTGNGIAGITTRSISTNIVFELLFLVPGVAIAYLVVKEGRGWRTTLVITCTLLLAWVTWAMKQRVHAEAMKRQSQAIVSLNARGLNNKALVNEAAAATSFGVAKAKVSLFYQQNGTNGFVLDQRLGGWSVLPGAKVKQLNPEVLPVVFEGEAFTQVVLPNTNGSFVGGAKTWVEAWKFDWTSGAVAPGKTKNILATPSTGRTFTIALVEPNKKYEVDKVRQGQQWSFPAFTGEFQSRVDGGDDKACWETVKNTLPWRAEKPGTLEIRTGQAGSTVTVTVQN